MRLNWVIGNKYLTREGEVIKFVEFLPMMGSA